MKRFPRATISHPSPQICADELLDVVPAIMREIRTRMRQHSAALPSVVHFRTLAYVNRHPDADVSSLAAHIGLSLPSASKLVQTLLDRGYLRRQPDRIDRRRSLLTPTPKGRRVVDTARRATRDYLATLLQDLPPAQRATIIRSMQTLRPIFRAEPPTSASKPDHAPRRSKTRTTAT
ncbi:MAG TPA: MarR family winged helix-turn-helix transcriptional regulator [Tepidisphaeraceae bacterium]|nr:MarR family winged helix-turn-helix transcriptional regulator [Tepidisphaeraceae bacterium]